MVNIFSCALDSYRIDLEKCLFKSFAQFFKKKKNSWVEKGIQALYFDDIHPYSSQLNPDPHPISNPCQILPTFYFLDFFSFTCICIACIYECVPYARCCCRGRKRRSHNPWNWSYSCEWLCGAGNRIQILCGSNKCLYNLSAFYPLHPRCLQLEYLCFCFDLGLETIHIFCRSDTYKNTLLP